MHNQQTVDHAYTIVSTQNKAAKRPTSYHGQVQLFLKCYRYVTIISRSRETDRPS